MHRSSNEHDRRRFLVGVIRTIQGAIGGTLAFLLGGAVVFPRFRRGQNDWIAAATLGDLQVDEPTPVMLRMVRDDGYMQVADRQVVFLVKNAEGRVTALSSTCTHLGCRVSWDPDDQLLRCPCHGGEYDRTGAVVAGPPPAPLARVRTRVEDDNVLVQV